MPVKLSRLHRLLRLIYLLQGRTPLRADRLAEQLGVTVRTLYRDFNQLELANIPFYFDDTVGGYRIASTYFLPPVQLTFEEALAVLALDGQSKTHPAPEALHAGLLKLANALPVGLRVEAMELLPRIGHRGPRRAATDRDVYRQLIEALRKQTKLRTRYHSVREDCEFDTLLSPYAIFFHKHSWYAHGHSSRDKRQRTFKLARFLSVAPTTTRYTVPKEFDLERSLGGAWGIIAEGSEYDVRIRFGKRAAPYVRETVWHASQRVEETGDGGCRLCVRVKGLDELLPWVLSWGSLAVVENPVELKQAIRRELEASLASLSRSL